MTGDVAAVERILAALDLSLGQSREVGQTTTR